MQWKSVVRWLWNNIGNFATIGGWAVSAGFLPVLLSFNEGVTPVGYGIASLLGLFVFAVVRACWIRANLWTLDAKHRAFLSSQSSAFDPMASIYQGKRIFLRDLVPPGRRLVSEKKFINCEIIGPGNIAVALNHENGNPSIFKDNIFHDVDCIQIAPGPEKLSRNAIYFPGCDFDGCHFHNVNLLFYERQYDDWHWITPIADNPPLITEQKDV